MNEEKVTLRLKSSWKWFIYLTQLVALFLVVYLLLNLWSVAGFSSPESLFLNVVFGLGGLWSIYFMIYASKHKVHFYEDRLTKEGVFSKKSRSYDDLNEVWLSTKFWDMRSPVAIIGNSSNIVFDYRYDNQDEVAEFLTNKKSIQSLPKLYFDTESLTPKKG